MGQGRRQTKVAMGGGGEIRGKSWRQEQTAGATGGLGRHRDRGQPALARRGLTQPSRLKVREP